MNISSVETFRKTQFHPNHLADVDAIFESVQSASESFGTASAKIVKKAILKEFENRSWSVNTSSTPSSPFRISANTRHGVSVQVQFGNIANAFYDLMKLQYLHDSIGTPGVLIIPMLETSRMIASNVANFEVLNRNLKHGFQNFITLPLVLVGIEEKK